MSYKSLASTAVHYLRIGLAGLAMFQFTICAPFANAADQPQSATASPITHVIVIIGENRSFDHVFATYQPKHGETVNNLLSEGIVLIGFQQERNSRSQLQQSATAFCYRCRHLPVALHEHRHFPATSCLRRSLAVPADQPDIFQQPSREPRPRFRP